jgi:hypothetical protein
VQVDDLLCERQRHKQVDRQHLDSKQLLYLQVLDRDFAALRSGAALKALPLKLF